MNNRHPTGGHPGTAVVLASLAAALAAMHVSRPAAANPRAAAVPQFGVGQPALTVIATSKDGLDKPRDLAFHPNRPAELWTVNQGTNGTVTIFNPGVRTQSADARVDHFASHFMSRVSSLDFGAANAFATCQESRNGPTMNTGDDFMGPTLWLADMKIYARVNQGQAGVWGSVPTASLRRSWCAVSASTSESNATSSNASDNPFTSPSNRPSKPESQHVFGANAPAQGRLGSHIDMNHESPLCMGIAHDRGNVYWVADGLAGNVVRYDFVKDHGPGNEDHSDAVIRRYPEAQLKRVAEVPSHLVLDPASGWLYYADTGAGLVRRLDTRSGKFDRKQKPQSGETVAELSTYRDANAEVFVEAGLVEPSGVALAGDLLFVGDHDSGRIHAYLLADGREVGRIGTGAKGLMGLTIGPDGKLWYVDAEANTVVRVDPVGSAPPTLTPVATGEPASVTPARRTATPEPIATVAATPVTKATPTLAPSATTISEPTSTAVSTSTATRFPTATPDPLPTAWRTFLPRLLRRW